MTLTFDEAKTKIGELVWVHSRNCGRPHTAKLIEVLGHEAARVHPGGHKKVEVVALNNLSRWAKGEHQMAELRRKTAEKNGANKNGHGPEWVSGTELLKIARPDRELCLANISNWKRSGWIPADCIGGTKTAMLYHVERLRACGFFDKVKPRPALVVTQAAKTPAEPQKLTLVEVKFPPPPMEQAPTPPSPPPPPQPVGIDMKTRLRNAIRNRSEAEAMLFEARAEEVRARAAIELADLA